MPLVEFGDFFVEVVSKLCAARPFDIVQEEQGPSGARVALQVSTEGLEGVPPPSLPPSLFYEAGWGH